jgi:MFS family permease
MWSATALLERNRNLVILFVAQTIAVSGSVLIVMVGGLVGTTLSSNPALATLPLSVLVLGTAAATVFAAMLMRRIGRRLGCAIGAAIAASGGFGSAYGLYTGSFTLFCVGIGAWGVNNAFVQQYRFAAAESVAPTFASRAISFVLLGAIGGAICGPALATVGQHWIAAHEYMGAMLAIGGLQLVAIVLFGAFREPVPTDDAPTPAHERPLPAIVAQPTYLVAMAASVVGYGVMNLVMTATPLSMHVYDGHSLDDTAWVIQSHVLAMYVPSFFSGVLIARLGVVRIVVLGIAALIATLVAGLWGHQVVHYWWALVTLGIGWNFLFVGGTALLVDSYRPAERFKAQAANEFAVFGASAAASLLAGTLIHAWGWNTVLWSIAPLLLLVAGALLLLPRAARQPWPAAR